MHRHNATKQSEIARDRSKFLAHSCQSGDPYRLCSAIAETLHRDARGMVERGYADLETAPLIAGRTAIALMSAEQALGHNDKVVRLVPEITAWLSRFGDTDDLASLQLKRLESLIELERIDEAERDIKKLQQTVLPPQVQLSLQVLTVRLRKVKANGPELPLRQSRTMQDDKPLLRRLFVELIRSAALLASVKAVRSSLARVSGSR